MILSRFKDVTLLAWIPEHQTFLDEMMCLNGRGLEGVGCQCGEVSPQFWCCNYVEWVFFQHVTFKSLGVRVQLGHNPGEKCYNPVTSAGDDFVIIGIDGVHKITLDFCGCASAQVQYKQLLLSVYEFYHLLARCTDNSGLLKIRDCYTSFMRMVCQWCNIKQLGSAGRGHDPARVDTTCEGELAVLCPACPQPRKNLPLDWEKELLFIRWKYALFVAIDVNFRLKRKAVSSDTADPSLNVGWGYFVWDSMYKSYLVDHATEKQEQSTCVSHNTVNTADTKSSRGLAATGVGMINCARHDMKLPNGIGDLQKGERYINMDYVVCSALLALTVCMINISYSIACQWHKKLWSRMETMPEQLHLPSESSLICFFVPKFHIQAHIDKCCMNFSFKWSRYIGRTDGEAPERGWANINCIASSTKEMGLGTCRDTLDNYFGDWNWKKMVEAVKWAREHSEALTELEKTIQLALIAQWKAEVKAWKEDNSSPNPFEIVVTQAAIRLELTELEAQDLQAGINVSLHTDISLSGLINSGMDLEDQQSKLADVSLHDTDKQKATLQTQITSLQRQLNAWACVQELYMPVVCQLHHQSSETSVRMEELKPQDFELWLPSQLPIDMPTDKRLARHEWDLCYAQALDALNDVCSYLHLQSHMYKYKDKNIHGQVGSTCAKKIINTVESRKQASILKYRRAWNALLFLSSRLEKCRWEMIVRPLLDSDVKHMGDMEWQGTGTISWIWLDLHADNSCTENEWVQDFVYLCVHLEWCKARAHAHQWSEEVELLLEEMRHVIVFLKWQADWWKERKTL
ncbi:hypothetical protein EDB19DRAFT_1895244 [Suillus lakei]|nr:hypothetical protein EDB19DRAFT_1895244 [Suillus lakei]